MNSMKLMHQVSPHSADMANYARGSCLEKSTASGAKVVVCVGILVNLLKC